MPVHPQDTDSSRPTRPRANTNTFSSFSAWRRNKSDALQSSPLPPSPSPPIQVLIDDLTPPAVPSIQHARALASTLPTHSPLPRPAVLSPVLASLCSVDSPPTLQSAGYDILSAYWDNPEATTLSTSDRLILFSLFLGPSSTWNTDSWEPRFKALRAFTRFGSDIVGIELPFLGVLKGWIGGAFEGLVVGGDSLDRGERVERERSIELIANFVSSVTEKQEVVSRIPEQELAGILGFYAQLVEQVIYFSYVPDITHYPSLYTPKPLESLRIRHLDAASSPPKTRLGNSQHPSIAQSMTTTATIFLSLPSLNPRRTQHQPHPTPHKCIIHSPNPQSYPTLASTNHPLSSLPSPFSLRACAFPYPFHPSSTQSMPSHPNTDHSPTTCECPGLLPSPSATSKLEISKPPKDEFLNDGNNF
ncbi:hypothetical protein ONZ45_g13329 [Pleurotus djamor]|nr:hypothetical protein ONZ45_g13329 [Pleurotus djamor]